MNELVPVSNATALPPSVATKTVATVTKNFPHNLPDELNIVLGQTGNAYAVMTDAGNPYALVVGSKQLNNLIRESANRHGYNLRQNDLRDINHFLQAHAETAGICRDVWYRVGLVKGGIEIDMGDEEHTRVRITAEGVKVIKEGSETLFFRTASTLPMALPVEVQSEDIQ